MPSFQNNVCYFYLDTKSVIQSSRLDLTERKLAQEELVESRNDLQAIVHAIPDLLFEVGLDWFCYAYHSLPGNRLSRPVEEIVGHNLNDFLPAEALIRINEALTEAHETGQSVGKEFSSLYPWDARFYEISVSRKSWHSQPRFILMRRDITSRKKAEESLKKSERAYRLLINSIPDTAIQLFDRDLRYRIVGGGEIEKNDFDSASMEWKTLREAYPKEVADIFEPLYEKALRWESTAFEMPYGEYLYHQRTLPISDKTGEIFGAMQISTNITEQRRMETTIRNNHETFLSIMETTLDGAWSTDSQGRFLEINDTYCLRSGYTREELLTMKISDLEAKEDPETTRKHIEEIKRTGRAQFESRHRRKDGSIWDVEVSTSFRDILGGHLFAFIRDITERKRLENALKAEMEKVENENNLIQTLLNTIPYGMDIVDASGSILYANDILKKQVGKEADILGKKCWELYCDDGNQCAQCPLRSEIRIGITKTSASRGILGGKTYEISHTGMLYRWKKAVLEIFNDATERTEMENKLALYRDHLEELVSIRTDELKKVLQEKQAAELSRQVAELSNQSKSAFLANMSHEIRTPMNGILGFTELLLENTAYLDADQKEYLHSIDISVKHLLHVINSILDISKIEAGKFVLEEIPFDINGVFDDIGSIFSWQAQGKGVRLIVEGVSPRCSRLIGDPTRIRQAIINYLANALKFTKRGNITLRGNIIETSWEDAVFRFEVEDTGIGMGSEALSRIFRTFEQADSSTARQYGGSGLGLSITKWIAHLMGGEAWATSVPDQGSTFWFTARLKKQKHLEKDTETSRENPAVIKEKLRVRHTGKRILIVDDTPVNVFLLQANMKPVGLGFDVAENGEQAVEKIRNNHYDLILMDMWMPVMNGLNATEKIRNELNYDGPVIAITANAFVEDKNKCLRAGMDDVIVKPIVTEILHQKLLSWLDKGEAS